MSYPRCWLFLGVSIITSVLGLTLLKGLEQHYPQLAVLAMYALFIPAYYLRARAMTGIPVVVAYAVWEAAGLALVIIVGMVLFEEFLGPWRALGLVCLLTGSYLVHVGTDKGEDEIAPGSGGRIAGPPPENLCEASAAYNRQAASRLYGLTQAPRAGSRRKTPSLSKEADSDRAGKTAAAEEDRR